MAGTVELVHWNPRPALFSGRLGKRVRIRPRINNFGDLLGPVIVRRLLELRGIDPKRGRPTRLLSVGSVLRLAREGDTIWGTGANGKSLDRAFDFEALDVRATRVGRSGRSSGRSPPPTS
jgi:pyruvyltransferase